MIVEIKNSKKKNKRFRVILDNGKAYDFGLDTGETFIDHHDKNKRLNYRIFLSLKDRKNKSGVSGSGSAFI